MESNVEEACEWYRDIQPTYERLAQKVEGIIREVLECENIIYYSIDSRAKDFDSFKKKASKAKYTDPKNELMDLSGIRITTYFDSDVYKISKIIKDLFTIIPEHSVDKTEILGANKVGYRSVHYVAELPRTRTVHRENKIYEGLRFEIQIRTILQHAWAEIEHDRSYKFNGVLPDHLRRRFYLVAGLLEMADHEFDAIVSEIDKYAAKVNSSAIEGNLDSILIDTISIKEYIINKFPNITHTFGPDDNNDGKEIVEELKDFGVNTLKELDEIISDDLQDKVPQELASKQTILGILRLIMIINNHEKYFTACWKKHWYGINRSFYEAVKAYNVPMDKYIGYLNLELEPEPDI